jgi:hypothetical protein
MRESRREIQRAIFEIVQHIGATLSYCGGDIAGRSVTDLGIRFGVLSDPDQRPRSVFYFRAPLE